MANTTLTQYPAGQSQYRITFDYLSRQFVVVTLINSSDVTQNRVLKSGDDYRFLNATTLEILASQTGFDIIQINRFTSTDLLVQFSDGSVLTAGDLTNAELQAIHIAEEGRDQTTGLAMQYAEQAVAAGKEAEEILNQIILLGKNGYTPVGSFEAGGTVTLQNDVLQYGSGTSLTHWRWDGSLPKVVPAGSTPTSAGGIGKGKWVDVTDATLRGQLKSETGSQLVTYKMHKVSGAVMRSLEDRLAQSGSVLDFGADPTGMTDSSDAFQKAIDLLPHVFVPQGIYRIDKSLVAKRSVTISGEGNTGQVNRLMSFINMNGNIPFIRNWQEVAQPNSMFQLHVKRLFIQYNPVSRPEITNWQDHSGKVAFLFESTTPEANGLEFSSFEDIVVLGAWQFMKDTTGTYMTRVTRCEARQCRIGIQKSTGTTILLEHFYAAGCRLAYSFGAMSTLKMVCCAMDNTDISIAKAGQGIAYGMEINGVRSFSIDVFDAEVNRVSTDGGDISSLIRITDSVGEISRFTGLRNDLVTEGAAESGSVALFHLLNNSRVRFTDCVGEFFSAEAPPYTGSGYAITLLTDTTSEAYVTNSRFKAPAKKTGTTGTPLALVLAQGNVTFGFGCEISGARAGGTRLYASGGTLFSDSFATARASTPVGANNPTPIITLSAPGAYMVFAHVSGSGKEYMASAQVIYDGTASAIFKMVDGAFLDITAAGAVISLVSTGATTVTWSYIKL